MLTRTWSFLSSELFNRLTPATKPPPDHRQRHNVTPTQWKGSRTAPQYQRPAPCTEHILDGCSLRNFRQCACAPGPWPSGQLNRCVRVARFQRHPPANCLPQRACQGPANSESPLCTLPLWLAGEPVVVPLCEGTGSTLPRSQRAPGAQCAPCHLSMRSGPACPPGGLPERRVWRWVVIPRTDRSSQRSEARRWGSLRCPQEQPPCQRRSVVRRLVHDGIARPLSAALLHAAAPGLATPASGAQPGAHFIARGPQDR